MNCAQKWDDVKLNSPDLNGDLVMVEVWDAKTTPSPPGGDEGVWLEMAT